MTSETILGGSFSLAMPNPAEKSESCGIGNLNTVDLNWQLNYGTVGSRNAAMVNNDFMSDVTFVVGPPGRSQKIPAHKYVLATGSSVFYAMFYGELAAPTVEVPDVAPAVFLSMLRYLYCDEIKLKPDTVLPVLYISKKYMLPYLSEACVKYLHSSLTSKNVCVLLSQSRMFEEPILIEHCWEVIDAQTELSLHSEGICDLDVATLCSILERETLTCRETHLFSAAMEWAVAECKRRGITPIPENKRNVLGDAFYLLRIPSMTLFEYANGPAQSGVLTKDEVIAIFFYFTATVKPQINFPVRSRSGLKVYVCHRSCKPAPVSGGTIRLPCRIRCDSIKFSVDKRIYLVGYRLYGSVHGPGDYSVKIDLKRQGKVIAERNTSFSSDGSPNTFHVSFEHAIQIKPGISYSGLAIFDGGPLKYFGIDGRSQVTVETATFKFQPSMDVPVGMGTVCGQITELVFYAPSINPLITNKIQS